VRYLVSGAFPICQFIELCWPKHNLLKTDYVSVETEEGLLQEELPLSVAILGVEDIICGYSKFH
jgi:hypothetical protein